MNQSLKITKLLTFSDVNHQFKNISYCQEHKEDNKLNETDELISDMFEDDQKDHDEEQRDQEFWK